MDEKPTLSVIVPTYNEVDNMSVLIPKLVEILESEQIPHEILVMDDNSPDGTAKEVERIAGDRENIRVVVRTRNRGLSPAVIDGYDEATGDILLVMDADMSHPPEVVPEMYRAIADRGADISVGSRHTRGGGIENWPMSRKVISWGASMLARPLTSVTDPMSGFFAIKPDVIEGAPLKPKGYKILLEVLVKGSYGKVEEVPITFKDREHGESKLGSGVILNYVSHLLRLYTYPGSASLIKFLFVGGTGMLVDLGLFTLLIYLLGEGLYMVNQGISFLAAVTWNFLWNRYWTFNVRGGSKALQYLKFFTVAVVAFGIRSGLMYVGVELFGFDEVPLYQVNLFLVILIVTAINYLGSKLWAFKK